MEGELHRRHRMATATLGEAREAGGSPPLPVPQFDSCLSATRSLGSVVPPPDLGRAALSAAAWLRAVSPAVPARVAGRIFLKAQRAQPEGHTVRVGGAISAVPRNVVANARGVLVAKPANACRGTEGEFTRAEVRTRSAAFAAYRRRGERGRPDAGQDRRSPRYSSAGPDSLEHPPTGDTVFRLDVRLLWLHAHPLGIRAKLGAGCIESRMRCIVQRPYPFVRRGAGFLQPFRSSRRMSRVKARGPASPIRHRKCP
jgi:hypothetical protein